MGSDFSPSLRAGSQAGTPVDPSAPDALRDAHETATNATGWIQNHWSDWLAGGLRILLIAVIAIVLRSLIRRSITRLVGRMNRRAEAAASGNALRGLIVNGERRRQRSDTIGSVLRNVASFVILGTAVLMVLSGLGINLAPLLASAGVAGVAMGFGARNLVTDVLAGMFMLLEDQYGVGDRVDVGEASGTVLEIGLRVTQLRGAGGEIWYVRNGEIKRVGNLSQGWSTAAVDVQVRAGEDWDEVRAALVAAGEELSDAEPWNELLWEPVEVLGLDSLTLDSMVVRVSAKTMPGKSLAVERELRWRIKRALDRLGVESVDPGATLPPAPSEDPATPAAPMASANAAAPANAAAGDGENRAGSVSGGGRRTDRTEGERPDPHREGSPRGEAAPPRPRDGARPHGESGPADPAGSIGAQGQAPARDTGDSATSSSTGASEDTARAQADGTTRPGGETGTGTATETGAAGRGAGGTGTDGRGERKGRKTGGGRNGVRRVQLRKPRSPRPR